MATSATTGAISGRCSVDEVLRRVAETLPRWPMPPNREAFTDAAPRRLTYAEADRTAGASPHGCAAWGCRPTPSSASSLPNIVGEYSGHARRVARRHDRCAVAASLAARRCRRRAGADRRQGADHLRARRRVQSCAIRDARGGGRVLDPLCMRRSAKPSRRRRAVRRFACCPRRGCAAARGAPR